MMVSHDLPVHAQLVDRLGIMYAGQIVEAGGVREVMKQPLHPYSYGLINSVPQIGARRERLEGILGATPSPLDWPPACRFHNRCPNKMPICEKIAPRFALVEPGPREVAGRGVEVSERHLVACHLHPESHPQDGVAPEDLRQVNA
jgi:peptide/nickel transport system ATP-binding protein